MMIEGFAIYNSILFLALLFGYLKRFFLPHYFTVCLFLVLWIPLAIRYGIGRDYFSYIEIYKNVLATRDGVELGFYYINYILAYFNFQYQYLFAVTSFLTIYFCVKSFDRDYALVSIILFCVLFYLQAFSIIRQMLAVSLCLYSCSLWNKGYKYKSLIFLILAPLFHYSALIVLLLAATSKYIKINTMRCWFVLMLSFIFIFILNGVDFVFSSSILLDSKYGYYVTSAFNRPTEIGSGVGVVIALLLPFIAFIKATKLYEYNKNYNFMLLINLVYVISYIFSLKIYIFARFTDALSFVQILLIPAMLKISNPKGVCHNLMMAVVLLHVLLFEANLNANTITAGNITNSGLGIMPYKSILNTNMIK